VRVVGRQARCNRLSALLVQNWNTRNAVELELRRDLTPVRRAALAARLGTIIRQGSDLEAQMTAAAQALSARTERASA
jgi:hypothetical protein